MHLRKPRKGCWGVGRPFRGCSSSQRMLGPPPKPLPAQTPLNTPGPTPSSSTAFLLQIISNFNFISSVSPDGYYLLLPLNKNKLLSPGLAVQRNFFSKENKKGESNVPFIFLKHNLFLPRDHGRNRTLLVGLCCGVRWVAVRQKDQVTLCLLLQPQPLFVNCSMNCHSGKQANYAPEEESHPRKSNNNKINNVKCTRMTCWRKCPHFVMGRMFLMHTDENIILSLKK